MPESSIVGRKVKLQPHCLYYIRECPYDNTAIVLSVSKQFVNIQFGDGIACPCSPHELKYLNNKEVVIDE